MIDLEMVDRLYENSQSTGVRFRWGLFDKTMLLPMSQLPDAVKGETGEEMSPAELEEKAAAGWFPALDGAGDEGDEKGVPLYVPSRVGLFRALERDGWSADELRLVASFEEWQVDNVLTTDELAYVEDDLETLILFARGRLDSLENGTTRDAQGREIDRGPEIAEEREQLEVFEAMQKSGIPAHLEARVAQDAFRVRAMNDIIRTWLLDADRAKVKAGYSPLIHFLRSSKGPEGFKGGEIEWEWTVRSAMAHADPTGEPPLRVPGFVFRGDRLSTTRTLTPAEYGKAWREHGIDGYLAAWAKLHNERRCLNCYAPLSPDADERRLFCGEKCRKASKQRRHRAQNPEAIEKAQSRYWRSIEVEDDGGR